MSRRPFRSWSQLRHAAAAARNSETGADGVVGEGFVAVAGGVVVVVVGASVVVVGVSVAGGGAGGEVVVCAAGNGAAGGVVVVVRSPPGESVVVVALPAPSETPVLSPLFSRAEMAAPCATCLARSTAAT